MIYTLTLNPAIDYFVEYNNSIQPMQKTNHFKFMPGGKGINASIMLNNLGIKNKAIIISGGAMGQKLVALIKNMNLDIDNIKIQSETRINVKINIKGETFEFNSIGNKVNPKNINNLLKKYIINNIQKEDILLIMGSLPPKYSFEYLEEIVKLASKNKIKLVFDLSKDYLYKLVKYNPEIIKPNIKELEELFSVEINSKEKAMQYAKQLYSLGSKRVLISFDKIGAIYYDGQNEYYIKGIKIKEVNSSGAGDSMIAAFIAGIIQKLKIHDCLKLASGAGTASASIVGIADKDKVNLFKNQIKIKEKNVKNIKII